MEAPKEIYIDGKNTYASLPVFSNYCNIKYIRADLALTWEDIPLIEELINEVHSEYPCGLGAQSFGEEVIQRFNEQRNKR